ncbi:Protein rds1 [Beauveria bassiana D1-5]|uniref:Protein rds1 n=1 Tax=Beauveria bassiana D1-5 TaxID=1245745 RepID=A0A0A2VJF9_BEABA|nr:Protein rds1 [Beauveria bassiana D1-5]
MYFSQATIAAVVAAGFVSAAPTIEKRAGITDADILQYALTLEHLEDTFYRDGLAKYSEQDFNSAGFDSKVYNNIKTIASDEAAHVDFLTKGLQGKHSIFIKKPEPPITDQISAAGANPVAACTYDFGYKDVKSFLATASILEGVGVSAYLGAAADIMSKAYLTAAGSILTVESRHSSYIRASLDQKPFPQPFDTPLSYNEVYSLASGFIKSCPETNPPLPVKAFPAVAVAADTKMPIKAGDEIVLQTPGYQLQGANSDTKIYAAFIAVTGPVFVDAYPVDGGFKVQIPEGFAGQTYAVLTSCKDAVNDDTIAAGPAIIEIAS